MPRIREVRHVAGAAEQVAAALAPEVSALLYEQLEAFRGRELGAGTHVELLLVGRRAVRVSFFVDVDGALWIERLGVSP